MSGPALTRLSRVLYSQTAKKEKIQQVLEYVKRMTLLMLSRREET